MFMGFQGPKNLRVLVLEVFKDIRDPKETNWLQIVEFSDVFRIVNEVEKDKRLPCACPPGHFEHDRHVHGETRCRLCTGWELRRSGRSDPIRSDQSIGDPMGTHMNTWWTHGLSKNLKMMKMWKMYKDVKGVMIWCDDLSGTCQMSYWVNVSDGSPFGSVSLSHTGTRALRKWFHPNLKRPRTAKSATWVLETENGFKFGDGQGAQGMTLLYSKELSPSSFCSWLETSNTTLWEFVSLPRIQRTWGQSVRERCWVRSALPKFQRFIGNYGSRFSCFSAVSLFCHVLSCSVQHWNCQVFDTVLMAIGRTGCAGQLNLEVCLHDLERTNLIKDRSKGMTKRKSHEIALVPTIRKDPKFYQVISKS